MNRQKNKKKKTVQSRVVDCEGLRRAVGLEELVRPRRRVVVGQCTGPRAAEPGSVYDDRALPGLAGGGCLRGARKLKLELNPSRSHSHLGTGCRREIVSPSPPCAPLGPGSFQVLSDLFCVNVFRTHA